MAEARSIAAVGQELKHGVQLSIDEEGTLHLRSELRVPLSGRVLARNAARKARHCYRTFLYLLYPFTFSIVGVCMTVLAAAVVRAPPDSWLRSGHIANAVWHISCWMPWLPVPLQVRLAILACWTAFGSLLLLAWMERRLLRLLLLDMSWMCRAANTPLSLYHKLWFASVKLLTRGNPLMLTFQPCLPRLPVPRLQDTVDKFLASSRLLEEDDAVYERTAEAARLFLQQEGPRLQRYLMLKSWLSANYVTDWWTKYIYLQGRSSIAINSNYYCLGSGRSNPTHIQEARAAVLIHNILKFKEDVETERVTPIMVGNGAVPLDMAQYITMFSTSRVPGRDCDTILHRDSTDIRYVAMTVKGTIYKLNVYTRDGRLRQPDELEQLIAAIKRDAASRKPRPGEANLPALTALPRSDWAAIREQYLSEGANRRSLDIIESSLFWVALDDGATEQLQWSERALALIGGNRERPNIFFDKSLSLVVFANGNAGFNCEHSPSDAPVNAHAMECALLLGENMGESPYLPDGHVRPTPAATAVTGAKSGTNWQWWYRGRSNSTASASSNGLQGLTTAAAAAATSGDAFQRLSWLIPAELEEAIANATTQLQAAIDDLHLRVASYSNYGKGFVKTCGVSPDGYVQAALQLAYYRLRGRFDATYESSMTRLFRLGRTETVRPVTSASTAFVRTMLDVTASPRDKLLALRASCAAHVAAYTEAMSGKACDRHLFALYCVSVGTRTDSPFLKEALSVPWKLSTSQQPQQQTDLWDIRDPKWAAIISPGGGFAPVARDGLGVSYQIHEHTFFFHVSSLKSAAPEVDASRFLVLLTDALDEMRTVLGIAVAESRAVEAAAGDKAGVAAAMPAAAAEGISSSSSGGSTHSSRMLPGPPVATAAAGLMATSLGHVQGASEGLAGHSIVSGGASAPGAPTPSANSAAAVEQPTLGLHAQQPLAGEVPQTTHDPAAASTLHRRPDSSKASDPGA